jgi:hypothetical protein
MKNSLQQQHLRRPAGCMPRTLPTARNDGKPAVGHTNSVHEGRKSNQPKKIFLC